MSDGPKCYTTSNPTARKNHCCCECRGTIFAGEKYHVFSGVWDSACTFKTCAECEVLRSDVQKTIEDMDEYPEFGGLYECVFERCERNARPDWITRFMDTRRKRNAPESKGGWMEKREAEMSRPVEKLILTGET